MEIYNLTNERTLNSIQNIERYNLGADDGDGFQDNPNYWSPPREVLFGFELFF